MALVPAPSPSHSAVAASPPLRATERVAIILSLLEPDRAREIAAQLAPERVPEIIEAYERMRTVPRPVLLQTIATFVTEMRSATPRVYGGRQRAAALATAILEQPDDTDTDTDDAPVATGSVWDDLAAMEPEPLARLMTRERPSVIAAILARLPDEVSGQVMRDLPEEVAIAVSAQLAKAAPVSPTTLDAIRETIERASSGDTTEDPGAEANPLPHLAALLNRCPQSRQRAILDAMRTDDPDQADAIEARLIRFDGLGDTLPRNAAPAIFREIEESVLDTALRYGAETAPATIEFLYANISQRLAEQIRERIDARAMPTPEDGEQAQAKLVATILEWVEEKRFELTLPEAAAA